MPHPQMWQVLPSDGFHTSRFSWRAPAKRNSLPHRSPCQPFLGCAPPTPIGGGGSQPTPPPPLFRPPSPLFQYPPPPPPHAPSRSSVAPPPSRRARASQEDDIPGIVRYGTYEVLKKEVANPRVRWAYLPYSMHMAGPKEAIQHMMIRCVAWGTGGGGRGRMGGRRERIGGLCHGGHSGSDLPLPPPPSRGGYNSDDITKVGGGGGGGC